MHEEHGRPLGANKLSDIEHGGEGDEKYLSHLSLLRRHGPQLIAFLALLATLTRLVVKGASRDAGVLRRAPSVEGVSEVERLFTACLGEQSERLEDARSDTGTDITEWAEGGERRE